MAKILACGFVNFDIIAAGLPGIPDPGGVVYAPKGVKFRLGGHPANLSVDLLQLGEPPGSVGLAAAVGDDIGGRFVEDCLATKRVERFIQRVEGVDTGRSIVLVREGADRSFVLDEGANARLDYEHVLRVIDGFSPSIFYLACGILGDFDSRISEVLRACRSKGIMTMMDAVEPHGKSWDFVRPALPLVDVLHSNRQELRGIVGRPDLREGLEFLAKCGVRLPIVTDGPSGAAAIFGGELVTQPAFVANVVDPTGAGDAFCAGIALKLAEFSDAGLNLSDLKRDRLIDVLLFGQASGAACVGEIGTTPGVTSSRVADLLAKQAESVRTRTTAA